MGTNDFFFTRAQEQGYSIKQSFRLVKWPRKISFHFRICRRNGGSLHPTLLLGRRVPTMIVFCRQENVSSTQSTRQREIRSNDFRHGRDVNRFFEAQSFAFDCSLNEKLKVVTEKKIRRLTTKQSSISTTRRSLYPVDICRPSLECMIAQEYPVNIYWTVVLPGFYLSV